MEIGKLILSKAPNTADIFYASSSGKVHSELHKLDSKKSEHVADMIVEALKGYSVRSITYNTSRLQPLSLAVVYQPEPRMH